jgi:hypothetical protein
MSDAQGDAKRHIERPALRVMRRGFAAQERLGSVVDGTVSPLNSPGAFGPGFGLGSRVDPEDLIIRSSAAAIKRQSVTRARIGHLPRALEPVLSCRGYAQLHPSLPPTPHTAARAATHATTHAAAATLS